MRRAQAVAGEAKGPVAFRRRRLVAVSHRARLGHSVLSAGPKYDRTGRTLDALRARTTARPVSTTTAAGDEDAELPVLGFFPPLDGANAWLNSPPLTTQGLRGKVVLIDFWTYSCINCLRAMPYVKAWHERYKEHGLVVIGVHTPEFAFEKDERNVRRAAQDLGASYPVALDNDYAIWRAFKNRYWPAHYFIDANAHTWHHFGEGNITIRAVDPPAPEPPQSFRHSARSGRSRQSAADVEMSPAGIRCLAAGALAREGCALDRSKSMRTSDASPTLAPRALDVDPKTLPRRSGRQDHIPLHARDLHLVPARRGGQARRSVHARRESGPDRAWDPRAEGVVKASAWISSSPLSVARSTFTSSPGAGARAFASPSMTHDLT